MKYEVILVSYAQQVASSLPIEGQRALDEKLHRLQDDPHSAGSYDRKTDSWRGGFGSWEMIEYTIHDSVVRVVVLRVTWTG